MALGNQLQFKMGRFKDDNGNLILNNVAKKAGTVYVTTDEKAMYVDVDDSTRIRLGDVIQLNSAREAAPPFSEDALYYFIEENALLKWGPFGTDGAMAWKQLNSVSDVTANLSALTNRVSTLEDQVATLGGTGAGSVAEAKAAADAAQVDATQALADALAADTKAGNAATAASNAQAKADENAGLISGIDGRLSSVETSVTTLTGDENTTGSVAKAQKTADDAAAAASAADTKAGNAATAAANAQTTANEAKSAAGTNATAISGLDGRLSTAEGKVTTLTTDLGNLTARVTEAEGDIDDLEAYATTLKGADTVDGSVANAKKAGTDAQATADKNTEDIEAIDGRVTTVEGTATTLANTTVPNLTNRVKANEDNIKALQDNLGASDDTKTENTAFGRIAALEESLGGSSEAGSVIERLDEVEDAVEVQNGLIEGLTTSVGDNADAISNINGVLGDKANPGEGTVFKLIANNSSAITDNASDIKDLQDIVGDDTKGLVQQVNTNKTDIATLKTTVEAIPDTYVNKTDYAKDQEALAAEMEEQHELIIQSINAANGMTYKTAITAYNELPTASTEEAPVRVGDTYVVANEDGFINEGTVYYSGDLLIAKGDEVDGVITGEITWDHVKTGYVYKHEATMGAVAGTDNDVAVKLTSFQAVGSDNEGDLGQFTIKGGENVTVTVDAETKVITIGMAWDTF